MGTGMIELRNVSMQFCMAREKIGSLKEYLIRLLQGRVKFQEFWALHDVSFSVRTGEVMGMVGLNGAGKSTLLKLIAGVLQPTCGEIEVSGRISPLIELGAGFDPELTARENVFLHGAILGYSQSFLKERFASIIEFSELGDFVDVPLKNFSTGMTARLAFSIATQVEPEILLVDETLSVGDYRFQKKSLERMHQLINSGATVVLVSHNIDVLKTMCHRTLWIEHGKLKMIGETAAVCDAYLKQRNG